MQACSAFCVAAGNAVTKKQSVSGTTKLERPQKPKAAEEVYQQVLLERFKSAALKGCLKALGSSVPLLEVRYETPLQQLVGAEPVLQADLLVSATVQCQSTLMQPRTSNHIVTALCNYLASAE